MKYSFVYKGEEIRGNSPESLAAYLSRMQNIPIEEAVKIVNKTIKGVNFIPKEFIPKENKKIGLLEIYNGARAILKTTVGITESQEVINERASICSNCPKLAEVTGCKMCGFSSKLKAFTQNIKKLFTKSYIIPNNLENKYCSVCDCSLAVMLPAKIEDFKDDKKERPTNCWIKK